MNRVRVYPRPSLGIPQWQLKFAGQNGHARLSGIGDDSTIAWTPDMPDEPTISMTSPDVAPTTSTSSTGDIIGSIGSAIGSILSAFQTTAAPKPNVTITTGTAAPAGMSTTTKLLIAGGVIVGGIVLWKALSGGRGRR